MVESFAHTNSTGTFQSASPGRETPFWELEKLIAAGHPFDVALAMMIARNGGRNDAIAAQLHLTAWSPRPQNDRAPGYWQKRVEAERRA